MSNYGVKRARHRAWPRPTLPPAEAVVIVEASKPAPIRRPRRGIPRRRAPMHDGARQAPNQPNRPKLPALCLEVVSQRLEFAGADQGAGQVQERGQDVAAALVADREAPVGQQPGQRPLHLPAVATPPGVGLDPTPGDPGSAAPSAQQLAAARVVLALIAMQLGRSPPRPTWATPWPDARRHGVHHGLQQLRIVGVGRRQPHRQRDPTRVNQQVVLGAGLAAVDRIRADQFPPRRARTLTESIAARDQSTWPSSPSQSNSRWCKASHTPAACQSRSRRQQVTGLPQPSSRAGSSRQGTPARST
jgi:hypothetical protein